MDLQRHFLIKKANEHEHNLATPPPPPFSKFNWIRGNFNQREYNEWLRNFNQSKHKLKGQGKSSNIPGPTSLSTPPPSTSKVFKNADVPITNLQESDMALDDSPMVILIRPSEFVEVSNGSTRTQMVKYQII